MRSGPRLVVQRIVKASGYCLRRGYTSSAPGVAARCGISAWTRALTSKGGAIPAERRGIGALRIATARSSSLMTMGRAAHCARPRGTLRLGAQKVPEFGGVGVGVPCPSEARAPPSRSPALSGNLYPVAAPRRVTQTTAPPQETTGPFSGFLSPDILVPYPLHAARSTSRETRLSNGR